MNKGNLNKLVTNYPVELTEEEISNLSGTLAPVIAACGGGGGGTGGKIYTGIGFVNVNNTTNQIGLTNEANTKLNQDIPTKVSDLTDSASYQTVAGMDQYLTELKAQSTYLTKSSAAENLAPISVTGEVNTLKAASANWNEVSAKLGTAQYQSDSATFLTSHQPLTDYYKKNETSSKSEIDDIVNALTDTINGVAAIKQDTLNFGYDINDTISSIDGSALAGQGGTTYSAGAGISITNDTISISADYIQAITSVSAIKGTVLTGDANIRTTSAESGNNIVWTMELTAQPTVTDTTLSGADGIVAVKDSSVTSQWNVTIAQAYRQEIEAVSGKLTKSSADTLYAPISVTGDVDTLKSSSGNWNKVSDKLDTTAFSNVSGTFLTAHQSLDDYYTKTQVDSTFASATQLNDYLTTAKYQTDSATFALKNEIPTTVAQLTDSGNYYKKTETSSKTEITNALNTKVDKPISTQTGKLVYDGDTSAWVTLPAGTTTIVQGQGSVTANYDSSNSTYTVSLLASAENALNKVADKIDTTAVAQTYQTISDMANYLTTSDAADTYQPKGNYAPESVTATVNTLTAASARWDEVSAKLGTAQYATDSATFVTKPDTTQTVLNNNYLIYSTLTDPTATTGWMPLSANYYSKTEADGRYAKASAALTSVSANTPLSGNGTTANPLGFDLTNAYTIDGTNGITAVPNSTTNKVVVQMTNDVWTDTQVVHSSISAWNEVSGLSAKSTVSANTATNVISVSANSTATTANISATTYYTNTADSNLVAQRLFVVHNDNDLVAHVQAGLCQGQGSLFFVMSGFNS